MDTNIKRYVQLRDQIGKIGLIIKGTITERRIVQGKKTYGPYYQWTFKVGRKTVTVNLSKEQEREYSKAIKNFQKVRQNLKQMEELSRKILEMTTVGVKKRKKKSP